MTPMAYLYICDGDIDDPVLTRKKMDWPEKYPHWQEIPLVMAQPEQELLAWKNAALRVGEDLSSVGPKGYYNMTAQQWLDWAMAQQPRGNNSLAQPEQDCDYCGGTGDVSGEYPGVACPECNGSGVRVQPEFIKHEVENAEDWSEWVCPNPQSYLMKCCDCGLVHEAEFGVVRYKSETEREDCDMVNDPNLQAVFRMRRSEEWSPKDTAYRPGGLAQPEQEPVVLVEKFSLLLWDYQELERAFEKVTGGKWIRKSNTPQRTWVGLTDDDDLDWEEGGNLKDLVKAIEAKLKEKNCL